MDQKLRQSWSWQLDFARDTDARRPADSAWPPAVAAALVAAVHATTLRRLHPFTSMDRLCLSTGAQSWAPESKDAPAFVSLDPEGRYNVWSGSPDTEAPDLVLTTPDAERAAAEFERLLFGWA